MNILSSKAKSILIAVTLTCGIYPAYAKNPIKDLTSNKKAKNVQGTSFIKSQIPKGLKKHSLGVGVGQTFVAGDFSDHGEDKITWDLLYNFTASHSFDLLTGFHISKHKFKETYSRLMGATVGIKAKLFQFDAFSPFAVGGFGFYSPKVRRYINSRLVESESKISFGYHMGVGGDLRLNDRVSVGVMAQYHNPFDVKQEIGSEVEGRYYKLLITSFYTF